MARTMPFKDLILSEKKEVEQSLEVRRNSSFRETRKSSLKRPIPSRVRANKKKVTSRMLENYQFGEKIGQGQFGCVYKALNMKEGTFVAIKQIDKHWLPSKSIPDLKNEIELLRTVNHENIVKVHGQIETEESLFIILSYIENGSLYDVIRKYGSFPESLTGLYTRQVLEGIRYLHSKEIVHHDIKAANILLTKEGTIVLADFGVAKKLIPNEEGTTASKEIVGTPYWMAPEIVLEAEVGLASDIWGIGCTVIELLCGEPPYFELGPMQALFKMVQDDHPPFPDEIQMSQELKAFLMCCFEKDPKKRATADCLLSHTWLSTIIPKTRVEDIGISVKSYNETRELTIISTPAQTKPTKTNFAELYEDIFIPQTLPENLAVIILLLITKQENELVSLMEALEKKMKLVNERVTREEKMWESLQKLRRVYKLFFNTKSDEAKEAEKMVQIQQQKLQETMDTSTKYQKTLLFQIIQVKDSTFEKGKLLKNSNKSEGILPAKKGDLVWILNKEAKDNLVQVQSIETFQHGLLPSSILQIIPKDKVNVHRKKSNTNTSVVEEARNALGEVTRKERIDRLAKFFGTSTNSLNEAVKKSSEDQKEEKSPKDVKELKKKIKDLKKTSKEWENKYTETKMLLSRVQMQNSDLQKEVWELRQKLKQIN